MMDLIVSTRDLEKELQLCQGVAEKHSTTIPILRNVLLSASGDRLHIAATDIDITIRTSIPATVTEAGAVAIEAKRFYDIVRSLSDNTAHLTLQENNSLLIESGMTRFRVLGLSAEDYPTLPEIATGESFMLPLDELKTMISKTIHAVSREETRFQFAGALFSISAVKMEMVTTDGYRMALMNYPRQSDKRTSKPDLEIVVPPKALSGILGMTAGEDGNVHISTSEDRTCFATGGQSLFARAIDLRFPDYMSSIAKDNDRRALVDRERLLLAVRRILLIAKERTSGIRFDFEPGKLIASSINPALGDAREVIAADFQGDPIFIGLSASYMMDVLSAIETPKVTLDLKDENAQCIVRPFVDDDELPYEQLCIIMPMRIA